MPAFDQLAPTYDTDFSYSQIGAMQRLMVSKYLVSHLPNSPLNILEINCGTGEDAVFLAKMQRKHQILATDYSTEMIRATTAKVKNAQLSHQITIQQLNIQEIHQLEGKFDLIFSNFGGLNCLSPEAIRQFGQNSQRLLKKDGRMIAVIMSTFCLWEHLYFIYQRDPKKAFRRWRKSPADFKVGQEQMPIWYYSPKGFQKLMGSAFQMKACLPIGLLVPPSYLESFFQKHPNWLQQLYDWEWKWGQQSFLGRFGDHYLIDSKLL